VTPKGWEKLDFWLADVRDRLANLQHFVASYEKLPKSSAIKGKTGRRPA
jgi:hypothetical protein